MRCDVQRSDLARVTVAGEVTGAIYSGLVVLAGFAPGDTEAELAWMARKLPRLCIFRDDEDCLNRSLIDTGSGILSVSLSNDGPEILVLEREAAVSNG